MKFCDECHETTEHMHGCPNEPEHIATERAEEQSAAQVAYDRYRLTSGIVWPEFSANLARMTQDAETLRRLIA